MSGGLSRKRRRQGVAALAWPVSALLAAAGASGAAAQGAALSRDGFGSREGRPVLTALGGGFTASPVLRLDADAGSFSGRFPPGDLRDETDLRRARVGVEGAIGGALEYGFIWDFGRRDPAGLSGIYEA